LPPVGPARIQVEFSTENSFRSEFASNIANGGIFVATDRPLDVREVVVVSLCLTFCDERVDLEGEVVHCVSEEMAGAGATRGVAVQFDLSAGELRDRFEKIVGPLDGNERKNRSGRRAAPRTPARVLTRVQGESGRTVEGRTRDISDSGLLVSVRGEPLEVDERVTITLHHPETGETLDLDGRIARHLGTEGGDITAMGIEITTPESRKSEVASFLNDIRAVEHQRRLGGINGSIAELGIENLLQMFGSSSPQGTLTVSRGANEGFISFQGGLLHVARLGRTSGSRALREMLAWREGTFEFHASLDESELSENPISLSAAILDALCEIDESRRDATAAGGGPAVDDELELGDESFAPETSALDANMPARISPDTSFSIDTAALDAVRDELTKTEEAVIDLAMVGLSVVKMVAVIPEPEIDVLTALDSLLERGLITCQ
jgi:Tfp pilus assembly protein PilZ